MKTLFFLYLFFSIYIYGQSRIDLNLNFNNNRFCLGVGYLFKKNFSLNLNGGLLAKDEFSFNRSYLLSRILKNTNDGLAIPFETNGTCLQGANIQAYKATFYGMKGNIAYYKDLEVNKKSFIQVSIFVGLFYGKGTWSPTSYILSPKSTITCSNFNFNESIIGWFGGLQLSYFYSIDKSKNKTFGIGIFTPFYKPLSPYYYRSNGIQPLLSGAEPEIKISYLYTLFKKHH